MENNDPVSIGIEPTKESELYLAWGREMLKGELKGIGDSLKQMVGLSTALAGSAILFNTESIFLPLKILAILAFLASLAIAFLGSMPFEASFDPDSPSDIKRVRSQAVESKLLKLKLSFWFLSAGLVLAGAGLLVGAAFAR